MANSLVAATSAYITTHYLIRSKPEGGSGAFFFPLTTLEHRNSFQPKSAGLDESWQAVGGFSSGGVVVVKCAFPRPERGRVIVKKLMQRGFFPIGWGNGGIWSTT